MDARLLLWIALGGAIGAVLRHLVGAWTHTDHFPYGTLIVNVVGSFALALFLAYDLQVGTSGPSVRAFVAVGLLGAFTTMSTFSHETLVLYTDGEPGKAALNVALNLGLSLGAVLLGWTTARLLAPAIAA